MDKTGKVIIISSIAIAFSYVVIRIVAFMYGYSAHGDASNKPYPIFDINTKIRHDVCRQMLDVLFAENKYWPPNEYLDADIEHVGYVQCFFEGIPNEIYTISTNDFYVDKVYNIDENLTYRSRDKLTEEEVLRMKKRIQNTLLKDIEQKAKEYGLCDCEIYSRNPYIYSKYYDDQIPSDSLKKINRGKADSVKYACRFISDVGERGIVTPVISEINTEIIQQLTDSLNGKYDLPKKIAQKTVFKDTKSRVYYFSSPPEEMYFVKYHYNLYIHHIYNFTTDSVKYKSDILSEFEINRIETRFENTVLKDIEAKAKELGIPDSVLYKQPL